VAINAGKSLIAVPFLLPSDMVLNCMQGRLNCEIAIGLSKYTGGAGANDEADAGSASNAGPLMALLETLRDLPEDAFADSHFVQHVARKPGVLARSIVNPVQVACDKAVGIQTFRFCSCRILPQQFTPTI
jgi:hypothetical protein